MNKSFQNWNTGLFIFMKRENFVHYLPKVYDKPYQKKFFVGNRH